MRRNLASLVYQRGGRGAPCGGSHPSTSSPSPVSPTPAPAVVELFNRTCEGLFRSSMYRERLCRTCHEPSPQVLKQLLDEFRCDRGVWANSAWNHSFTSATTLTGRADLCAERFSRWYVARQAPRKVRMSAPWDWYPHARLTHRTFYFHHGPTNSGKTRAALQALVGARSGVYAAPLKALAGQVWRQVNEHVPCDLLIGDERRFRGDAEHVSCTVEMTPVDVLVDVGVIDEVQLIGDKDRGWAWTRALLGLPAREIHLCGEERAIPLVEQLLYQTYEKKRLHLVEHRRLVPLECGPSLGGDVRNVENGDCLVCFSRRGVLGLQRRVEASAPGARVSFVYGAMPFGVREQQATRFNDGVQSVVTASTPASATPAARHVLVATDAVAYGLNMNIERIVFTTLNRFDGSQTSTLPPALIKQISGRAGRFGVARQHPVGRYTTLHEEDLVTLQAAMQSTATPLQQAGLLPSSDILQLYAEMRLAQNARKTSAVAATARPQRGDPPQPQAVAPTSFANLLREFIQECHPTSLFFACDMTRSLLRVADVLEPLTSLSLPDRILFCYVPLNDSSDDTLQLLCEWARAHASGSHAELRVDQQADQVASLPATSERRALEKRLQQWERLYKQCEMYCWLSWRFRTTFVQEGAGSATKVRCCEQIACINDLLARTD